MSFQKIKMLIALNANMFPFAGNQNSSGAIGSLS